MHQPVHLGDNFCGLLTFFSGKSKIFKTELDSFSKRNNDIVAALSYL